MKIFTFIYVCTHQGIVYLRTHKDDCFVSAYFPRASLEQSLCVLLLVLVDEEQNSAELSL